MVCIFCAEVILAKNNSGYLRSFVVYKAQKTLKKHIYKLLLLNKSSYIVDCFVYLCVQIKDICKWKI